MLDDHGNYVSIPEQPKAKTASVVAELKPQEEAPVAPVKKVAKKKTSKKTSKKKVVKKVIETPDL